LVFWERDDDDFEGEVFRGGIEKTYDSCWSEIVLEDLVIRGIEDEASGWMDHVRENGFEDLL